MFYLAHVPQKQNFFVERCFLAIQFSTFGHLCTDLPPRSTYSTASGNLRCKSASNLKNHLILYIPGVWGRYWQCVQVSL